MRRSVLTSGEAAMTGESWCIVGGGMLGLSLAHKLAGPGRTVTVLEASPRLGGLADAWRLGPVAWDRFYHVTLLSDRHLRGLLADIGLEDQLRWKTTKTDFYSGGTFHPLNNAIDFLRFKPLGLVSKARLAATIIYGSLLKDGVSLEKIPVETWLTRLSGRRTYEVIWRPLLRAKLGDNSKLVSASFIWSVINRFYAARRAGMKTEMFGYVRGGYGRIVERLTASLRERGVACAAGAPVSAIRRHGDGFAVETQTGVQRFDRVVVTVPGALAARICPELTGEEKNALTGLRYQGVVCTSVLLKRGLRGRYLTYVADETIPFTGVIEMTAVVDAEELGGHALVYLPRYVPAEDPLFEQPDEAIEANAITMLLRMYPDLKRDDIVATRVARARHVMAVQRLNYSRSVPPMDTSLPGLSIVNSSQIINANLNVDETIAFATRAASHLVGQPGREAEPALDPGPTSGPARAAPGPVVDASAAA
ncbi:NAD(P)/FAD-dependent oxidoreductase [Enterovirga sp.]|uniref:NAD(P)/FAD-dependent oxidoreductase n=1 Tax=Enterovirga sp. TaxID=2026350 RepID=UPI002627F9F9|nr:NAD(P)/FAD-dependent oxidoreductase [Enterovirga sp.]